MLPPTAESSTGSGTSSKCYMVSPNGAISFQVFSLILLFVLLQAQLHSCRRKCLVHAIDTKTDFSQSDSDPNKTLFPIAIMLQGAPGQFNEMLSLGFNLCNAGSAGVPANVTANIGGNARILPRP